MRAKNERCMNIDAVAVGMARRQVLAAGVAGLLLPAGLGACQTPPPAPDFPVPRFTDRPPFRLAVAVMDVVSLYQAPGAPPFAEHRFAVPPAVAAEAWARDRLVAAGHSGSLTVYIDEASVRETRLPVSKGIGGVFTNEQSERYDGSLVMRLVIEGGGEDGTRNGKASATSRYSRTVAENFSYNDRRRAFHEITMALIDGLDREMELRLRNDLAPLLVR